MSQVVRKTPEHDAAGSVVDLGEWSDPIGDAPPHDLQRKIIERFESGKGLAFLSATSQQSRLELAIAKLSRFAGLTLFGLALVAIIAVLF